MSVYLIIFNWGVCIVHLSRLCKIPYTWGYARKTKQNKMKENYPVVKFAPEYNMCRRAYPLKVAYRETAFFTIWYPLVTWLLEYTRIFPMVYMFIWNLNRARPLAIGRTLETGIKRKIYSIAILKKNIYTNRPNYDIVMTDRIHSDIPIFSIRGEPVCLWILLRLLVPYGVYIWSESWLVSCTPLFWHTELSVVETLHKGIIGISLDEYRWGC